MINLATRLAAMPITTFAFTSFSKRVTSNDAGEQVMYFQFELDDTIEKVVGSNSLYDPNNTNRRVNLLAVDVTTVSCSFEMLEKYQTEFVFGISNPTAAEEDQLFDGTGIYKGNMMLDVARSGQVWLTDTPYSKMAGEFKKTRRGEEFSKLLERTITMGK